jgi:hypothetical protein
VLVIATLGARQRWLPLRRRRSKSVAPTPEPTPVLTARATVVSAQPFASPSAAEAWLRAADPQDEAAIALEILNDVLHAYRTTTADPYINELSRHQALVARVGIGDGDELAEGRWKRAREVPEARERARRRSAAMQPQERLAALLGGRDAALACEELTLRARLDLDRGRRREAALQLRVALEAAIAELAPWVALPKMADRLEALRSERSAVGEAANSALMGGLDDSTAEDVVRALRKVEDALRARTYDGQT